MPNAAPMSSETTPISSDCARPEDQPATLVTAVLVEAEPVLGRRAGDVRRPDLAEPGLAAGSVRRDQRGEDRHDHEERDEPAPTIGERVAAQAPERLAPAAPADLVGARRRSELVVGLGDQSASAVVIAPHPRVDHP